jgi:hypothetical protein
LEAREISNVKVQDPNDGVQTTSPDTVHEDGHKGQCQSSKMGMAGKRETRTLSEGEFGQQTKKH